MYLNKQFKNIIFTISYLLCCGNNLYPQQSNYWPLSNSKFGLNFFSNILKIDSSYKLPYEYSINNSICANDGRLQLLEVNNPYTGPHILNSKLEKIKDSELKATPQYSIFLNFSENKFIYLYSSDSIGASEKTNNISNKIRYNDGLHLIQIVNNKITSKDKLILNCNLKHISASRLNDSSYLILCNSSDKMYSAILSWNRIVFTDSIELKRLSYIPDSLQNNPNVTNEYYTYCHLSHDASSFILYNKEISYFGISAGNIFKSYSFGLGFNIVLQYQIDRNNGKFGIHKILDLQKLDYNSYLNIGHIDFIYSSNNKKIFSFTTFEKHASDYIEYSIDKYDLLDINPALTKSNIITIDSKKPPFDTSSLILSNPKLSPFGEIIFLKNTFIKTNPKKTILDFYKIKNINEQNSKAKVDGPLKSLDLLKNNLNAPISIQHKHIYDYLYFEKLYSQNNCSFDVKIINKSDTSINFYKYTFIIQRGGGYFDTINGDLINLNFTKNGKYPFKVIGYAANNYTEIFEDTITIDKINYPIIKELNYPRSICKYQILKFDSYVDFKSIQSNTNSKEYHLGNGDPVKQTFNSFKPINNYYEKSGLYPITLIVSNSYCNDTLTDTLRVVDAPTPSLVSDKIQGCTPLEITFNDSGSLGYTEKKYWRSDLKQWLTIPNDEYEFKLYFNIVGNYEVIQKLYGKTCNTEFDTIKIKVFDGFEETDSINIENCTYINPNLQFKDLDNCNDLENSTLLKWHRSIEAIRYKVLRDKQLIIETRDSQIQINEFINSPVAYQIVGIDTCGTESKVGDISQPSFLTVNYNQLNNTALGIYSKYLGRKDYDLKYTFQKYINYNWVDINFNTNPTFDPEFLIENKNYSLYRVKITSISDPNWLSFSNTVCIPYQPIIFIPNAFSPNSDNINELFGPTTFGIEWYKIKILNQWGEIIFKGDKNQKWDGENTTNGVYTCIIEYKTNDGLLNTQRLNIHLLK